MLTSRPRRVKAEHLFDIVWEAIERIEHKKLKVIVVCSDGASTNRKLFRMHGESSCQPYHPVYKTTNRYSEEERPVFFMSDVPHLLKTTRNNWSHSFGHGYKRKLWVSCNVYQCIMVHLSLFILSLSFLGERKQHQLETSAAALRCKVGYEYSL